MHRTTGLLAATVLSLVLIACQRQPSTVVADYTTPYAVGSTTRFIHDSSRSYDSVGGVDSGIRILLTEIWYPVDHAAIATDPTAFKHPGESE